MKQLQPVAVLVRVFALACEQVRLRLLAFARLPVASQFVFAMSAGLLAGALADLASLPALLAAQEGAGLERNDCLQSMFSAWASRMRSLPSITAADRAQLTVAISEAPFTRTQSAELAKIVMMAGHAERVGHSTKTQTCSRFENFLLESEWLTMRAKDAPRAQLVMVLSTRAWLLNIYCPSQPLLLHLVRILAYCQNIWDMSQDDTTACMKQIQVAIKGKGKARNAQLPVLMEFPASVDGLPADLRIHAYGASGPLPIVVDIPELHSMLVDARMRRPRAPSWMSFVPPQYRHMLGSNASMQRGDDSSRSVAGAASPPHLAIGDGDSRASSPGVAAHPPAAAIPPPCEPPSSKRRRIPLRFSAVLLKQTLRRTGSPTSASAQLLHSAREGSPSPAVSTTGTAPAAPQGRPSLAGGAAQATAPAAPQSRPVVAGGVAQTAAAHSQEHASLDAMEHAFVNAGGADRTKRKGGRTAAKAAAKAATKAQAAPSPEGKAAPAAPAAAPAAPDVVQRRPAATHNGSKGEGEQ